MSAYFPLTPGQRGEAIRDLQRRLGAAGFLPAAGIEAGLFCASTESAVRGFQAARGLHASGLCDEHTWMALVEASWNFGDRQLFLTSPNVRGDDVAELQTRLATLGFDPGRVDGILGPDTARALVDFQSNCGLLADGVCGAVTLRALLRVSSQTGSGPGVTAVRERDLQDRGSGSIATSRLVIGHFGGIGALTRTVARELRLRGATVMSLDEPDALAQSRAANHFGADAYLGFDTTTESSAVIHYYQVPTFESAGGKSLAQRIATALQPVPDLEPEIRGMRLPVLRETRMPAVLCTLGPVRLVNDASLQVGNAVLDALQQWISRSS